MRTIGKYVIEGLLGRGGMGTVYLARDPGLERRVALKTLTLGADDPPELRLRFLREAQAAGGLRHPNIVIVYDVGEDGGQPYIAMEHVEGVDLERVLQRRDSYSDEWKLDVLRQVCDGLGYAHRRGVVHRDVKPANIRVTPDGEVKIMDFGLARVPASTMTKSRHFVGTIQYMAPEQVEGAPIDRRADVFSVGAMAYELFTHRKPFRGDSLTEVMFQIVHGAPDPAPLPANAYSPGLERIVRKAMARRPEDRYPCLDALRADLLILVQQAAGALPGPREP